MLKLYCTLSATLAAATIFLVIGFLVQASLPLFQSQGITFLFEAEWYPYEELYGMLPAVIGTLWSVSLALLIAVPLGFSAALFSAELLPEPARQLVRFGMELLAGIPSVVYGLIGLWVLLPILEVQFDVLSGRSLLAAGLLLALMILPTIMLLSEDAIRSVPKTQKEAATNLGLDWSERLFRIVIPESWPHVRTATLLSMGRAMGETIAVMLVVGSIDRIPEPWYNLLEPAQTLTSRLGREIAEAGVDSIHWSALMACGLLLALFATAVAIIAQLRPATLSKAQ